DAGDRDTGRRLGGWAVGCTGARLTIQCRLGRTATRHWSRALGGPPRGEGSRERKRAPAADRTRDVDAAAVGLNECLRDREPESHPTLITAPRLPEVIEQSRQIGGGDTWSGIGHLEFGLIVLTRAPQCDDTFRR